MTKTGIAAACLLLYVATLGILPRFAGLAIAGIGSIFLLSAILSSSAVRHRIVYGRLYTMPLLLIVSVGVVSTGVAFFNSLDVTRSAEMTMRLCLSLIFLCAGLSLNVQSAAKFIPFLIAAICFHGIIGTLSYFFGEAANIGGINRADGALTVNVLANLMTVGAVTCFGFYASRKPPFIRGWGWLAGTFFLLFVLILTSTLKNIIAIIPGIALIYWHTTKRDRIAKAFLALLFLAPILIFVIAESNISVRIGELLETGITFNRTNYGEKPNSLQWRIDNWLALLNTWMRDYLFLGAGIGQSPNIEGIRAAYGEGVVAHGDWVAILVEFGLLMGPVVVIAYLAIAWRLWRKATYNHYDRVTLSALYLVMLISMIGGNVIYTVGFLYIFWFLMGCLHKRPIVAGTTGALHPASPKATTSP